MKEPLTPANYFGKGENYVLPESMDAVREFEQQFDAWVTANPNDPTGEKAIESYKAHLAATKKVGIPPVFPEIQERMSQADFEEHQKAGHTLYEKKIEKLVEAKVESAMQAQTPASPTLELSGNTDQLKLQLPVELIDKLKDFAKAKRRRPRDIVITWILKHAHL